MCSRQLQSLTCLSGTLVAGCRLKCCFVDVTGVNGQYELRQLAKAGGYTESKCLFCGGLREYYLHKCGIELSEYLQC